MLAFRIVAAVTVILLLLVIGSFFWSLTAPDTGYLDTVAVRRISQFCGMQTECKARIGELFEGDWDTFYEFGPAVPQAEMDRLLGARRVAARAGERLLVLTKGGEILTAQYAKDGVDRPLEGEIEFEGERHREERTVMYRHDTMMRVNRFPIDPSDERSHSYFVLTAEASQQ